MKTNIKLDGPNSTYLHKNRILEKRFLHLIYEEWYEMFKKDLIPGNGKVLELGSGGGFIQEFISHTITSDLVFLPWLNVVLDGMVLPFADKALHAIVMINVLHHLPNPDHLLLDAGRCIEPGGIVLMVEPWVSLWSRFIYSSFHHEPFDPNAKDWNFTSRGRLSGANSALPWIIFGRDREIYNYKFPELTIESIKPIMPLRYLLSGGVSTKLSVPAWSYNFWKQLESFMDRRMKELCMFAFIKLVRAKPAII